MHVTFGAAWKEATSSHACCTHAPLSSGTCCCCCRCTRTTPPAVQDTRSNGSLQEIVSGVTVGVRGAVGAPATPQAQSPAQAMCRGAVWMGTGGIRPLGRPPPPCRHVPPVVKMGCAVSHLLLELPGCCCGCLKARHLTSCSLAAAAEAWPLAAAAAGVDAGGGLAWRGGMVASSWPCHASSTWMLPPRRDTARTSAPVWAQGGGSSCGQWLLVLHVRVLARTRAPPAAPAAALCTLRPTHARAHLTSGSWEPPAHGRLRPCPAGPCAGEGRGPATHTLGLRCM